MASNISLNGMNISSGAARIFQRGGGGGRKSDGERSDRAGDGVVGGGGVSPSDSMEIFNIRIST